MIEKKMPAATYFLRREVNKSLLDLVHRAPLLARMYLDGQYQRETTPSMRLGTLAHCLILEPDAYRDRYAIAPDCDRRTKEGKARFEQFTAESEGLEIITQEQFETANAIRDAVMNHPSVELLMRFGDPEVSIFSEIDGLPVKCRADWLREGFIADIKTTSDASPSGFARSCANFRYHVQAAFYLDIAANEKSSADQFVFVAVETKPPYLVACYTLDAQAIREGRSAYERDLATYAACAKAGFWPGLNEEITSLSLPRWAFANDYSGDY